jgi:hypothetical protein
MSMLIVVVLEIVETTSTTIAEKEITKKYAN